MIQKKKNPAAVSLGRKGGKNSRINLSEDEKTALGKKAAAARWAKVPAKRAGPRADKN